MNQRFLRKHCTVLTVCLLASLLLSLPALAETDVPKDTAALLKQWEDVMAAPGFVADESYLTEECMALMPPAEAVAIAVEFIKKVEKIGADALTGYTPSMTFYTVAPHFDANLKSGYWEVSLTPPEGEKLRPYFVEVAAYDPGMIKYNVLNEDGEITKVLRQDLDGRIFEVKDAK